METTLKILSLAVILLLMWRNKQLANKNEKLESDLRHSKTDIEHQEGVIKELEKLLDSDKRNNDLGERLMKMSAGIMKSTGMMDEDSIEELFGFSVKKEKSLEELLSEAEANEYWEEATRLRDLINSKKSE